MFAKLALAALTSAQSINEAFSSILTGAEPISNDQIDAMWAHYSQNEGNNSPNVGAPEGERKSNFRASLWRVIQHNKQEGVTWTAGINAFSDMTNEQFNAHFKIDSVKAE